MLTEIHQLLLARLDDAYDKLRAIHADKSFVNPSAKGYEAAREQFADAQEALFQCKSLWSQVGGS